MTNAGLHLLVQDETDIFFLGWDSQAYWHLKAPSLLLDRYGHLKLKHPYIDVFIDDILRRDELLFYYCQSIEQLYSV